MERNFRIISEWLQLLGYGEMSPKCEFWRDWYEFSTEKNDGFWLLLWGIFKEYIKHNIIIMAVLQKGNCHSVDIFRLMKKSIRFKWKGKK